MRPAIPSLLAAALVLGAGQAAPAAAAPKTASGTGQAVVLSPLSVLKKADLDFGTLVPSGAGTAVIDPYTGATSTSGPVVADKAGHAATFTTTGTKNSVVIVKVPTASTTLTRVGGGATMTVNSWTLDGSSNRKFPLSQTFDFSVGATLNIGANQMEGTYSGTFAVTVNYP